MESRNVPNRKNSSVTRSITYHLLECKIFYIKSWKRRSRNVCRLPDWFEIFAFWNTLEKFNVIISKSVTVVFEGPSSEYSGSRQCPPPHANLRKSSGYLRKTEATDRPVISIYLLQTEFRATKICLFMWRLWQAFGLSEAQIHSFAVQKDAWPKLSRKQPCSPGYILCWSKTTFLSLPSHPPHLDISFHFISAWSVLRRPIRRRWSYDQSKVKNKAKFATFTVFSFSFKERIHGH